MQDTSYKYYAFISYSHLDHKWGDWLHKCLENYKVPKKLVGSPGQAITKRIYPVFRDQEELASSSDLGASIKAALHESKFLIVISSPNSAKSLWVNEEILIWKRMGREDRILCLIVDGEPHAHGGESSEQECFANALKYKLGNEGKLTKDPIEPIAADARKKSGGREQAKIRLIAGLLEVNYDSLVQRNKQRILQVRILLSLLTIILLLVFFAAWWYQSEKILTEKLHKESLTLSAGSIEATNGMDAEKGIRLALQALPDSLLSPNRPYKFEAYNALAVAVNAFHKRTKLKAEKRQYPHIRRTATNQVFIEEPIGTVKIVNTQSGEELETIPGRLREHIFNFRSEAPRIIVESDNGLRLWDPETGKELTSDGTGLLVDFPTAGFATYESVFDPSGKNVISSFSDGTVKVWNPQTGTVSRTIPIFAPKTRRIKIGVVENLPNTSVQKIKNLSINSSGKLLLAASEYIAYMVDFDSGEVRRKFSKKGASQSATITDVGFSPQGGRLFIAYNDGNVQLIDVATGSLSHNLNKHRDGNITAWFDGSGEKIVTSVQQGKQRIWDVTNGELLLVLESEEFEQDQGNQVRGVSYSPDSRLILAGSMDGTARMWNPKAGDFFSLAQADAGITSVAFGSDSLLGALGLEDGRIIVWQVRKGLVGFTLLPGNGEYLSKLAFGKTNNQLVSTTVLGADAWKLNMPTLILRGTDKPRHIDEHFRGHDSIDGLEFSSNSEVLAIVLSDSVVTRRMDSGALVKLVPYDETVTCITFNNNNHQAVVGTEAGDVYVWNIENENTRNNLIKKHTAQINSCSFTPDGKWIITSSLDGSLRVWDASSGKEKWNYTMNDSNPQGWGGIGSITITQDSTQVAFSDKEKILIYEVATGKELQRIHSGSVIYIAFSPDGKLVAATELAFDNRGIRIWESFSGKKYKSIKVPSGKQVGPFTFSPDSQLLFANHHVIDVRTGHPIMALFSHSEYQWSQVAVSPNGKKLAAASKDGSVRIWDLDFPQGENYLIDYASSLLQ